MYQSSHSQKKDSASPYLPPSCAWFPRNYIMVLSPASRYPCNENRSCSWGQLASGFQSFRIFKSPKYITQIIGKTIAHPSQEKYLSTSIHNKKAYLSQYIIPPKSITEPFKKLKNRHNTWRQAKRHIVLMGIWIWIEKFIQWGTVSFLDHLTYEVWSISNSNQKMLPVTQLAHL